MIHDRSKLVTFILAIVLVFSITAGLYSFSFPPTPQPSIAIHKFEIKPTEFKLAESGQLLLTIENLNSENSTFVIAKFETHDNVEIYSGNTLLPKSAGNYTYTKSLDPKEKSDLKFTVRATLDVGDNLRNYYIKAYIYANGKSFGIEEDTFTVRRT